VKPAAAQASSIPWRFTSSQDIDVTFNMMLDNVVRPTWNISQVMSPIKRTDSRKFTSPTYKPNNIHPMKYSRLIFISILVFSVNLAHAVGINVDWRYTGDEARERQRAEERVNLARASVVPLCTYSEKISNDPWDLQREIFNVEGRKRGRAATEALISRGDSCALYRKGRSMYLVTGDWGYPDDQTRERQKTEGMVILEEAAKRGVAPAKLLVANHILASLTSNDPASAAAAARAFELVDSAAATGHVESRLRLAEMHDAAIGTPLRRDIAFQIRTTLTNEGNQEAAALVSIPPIELETLKRAADSGDARSLHELSQLYRTGRGVIADVHQADLLLKKASDRGYPQAQYEQAMKMPQPSGSAFGQESYDRVKATISLMRSAASKGHPEAKQWLASPDLQLSLKWEKFIAGDPEIVFNHVEYWWEFQGYRNPPELVGWLRQSAEKGYAPAQSFLSSALTLGDKMPASPSEAAMWAKRAAEQGFGPAQYSYGVMLNDGRGVNVNYDESLRWLRMADNNGVAEAADAIRVVQGNRETARANREPTWLESLGQFARDMTAHIEEQERARKQAEEAQRRAQTISPELYRKIMKEREQAAKDWLKREDAREQRRLERVAREREQSDRNERDRLARERGESESDQAAKDARTQIAEAEERRAEELRQADERQQRLREEQAQREKEAREKAEREEAERIELARKEQLEREERARKEREEKEARERAKREDRESALRDLVSNTRLAARTCSANDVRIVGLLSQSLKEKAGGCVNVSYLAQCPGSAGSIRGTMRGFVGVATDCYMGDAVPLAGTATCSAERMSVAVTAVTPCR